MQKKTQSRMTTSWAEISACRRLLQLRKKTLKGDNKSRDLSLSSTIEEKKSRMTTSWDPSSLSSCASAEKK
jgi:hypothetical protein